VEEKSTVSGFVDKNRKIRLGISGCGMAFERLYLPALIRSAEWELVGVCDRSRERCEWVRSLFPDISVCDSIDALLDASSLDAMFIATPPETHCELAVKALDRGLHVLVEKPMALSLEEAFAMLESSERAGRQLRVGFNRRFRRPYVILRDQLAGIPAESIQSITFEFIFSLLDWNPVTPYLGDDSRGGGALDDVASHLVDVLTWVIGANVSAVKAEPLSVNEGRGSVVSIELKFENGTAAKGSAGHGPRFSERLEVRVDSRRFVVFPAGLIETCRMPNFLLSLYCFLRTRTHFARHKLLRTPNLSQESMAGQLRDFAQALRGETHSRSGADAVSGIDALKATMACRESIRSGGKWISIKDLRGNRP
jgi:predicted dehydrogenase